LEKRGDVTIRLIRAFFQSRSLLAQRLQRRILIAHRRTASVAEERFQRAVHDQIRIPANRRREMRVVREGQAEVADVRRLIDGLRQGPNDEGLDEGPVRCIAEPPRDRLQVPRGNLVSELNTYSERVQRCSELLQL